MPTADSRVSAEELVAAYRTALQAYLAGTNEEMLKRAYDIGRAALLGNMGLLEVVEFHGQALKSLIAEVPPEEIPEKVQRAMAFLEESLSPFEITHRGYQSAIELVQHITWFASIASHEVKGPLTSLLSSAGMLKDMLQTEVDSRADKLLASVLDSVAILRSRANDMTDIASLYSGALSIRLRKTNLADFLKRVRDRLEAEILWRGLTLNLELRGELPAIGIDPERIEQVITNLVQNAARYASDGEKIDLSASVVGSYVCIEVRDYGRNTGPAGHISKVLAGELMKRNSNARGTGIGLILCRQLVAAHHGEITVLAGPDAGITFQIWLPAGHIYRYTEELLESSHR